MRPRGALSGDCARRIEAGELDTEAQPTLSLRASQIRNIGQRFLVNVATAVFMCFIMLRTRQLDCFLFHSFISSQSSCFTTHCYLHPQLFNLNLEKESWSCPVSFVSELASRCRGPSSHQKDLLQEAQERLTFLSNTRGPATAS